jgi:hypothetical protein
MFWIGVTQRSISSTALGSSERSARSDVVRVVDHRGADLLAHLLAAGREQVRPVEELVVVGLGKPHQLADHEHRQWRSHLAHEVALAAPGHRIEQLADLLPQVRLVRLDAPRS